MEIRTVAMVSLKEHKRTLVEATCRNSSVAREKLDPSIHGRDGHRGFFTAAAALSTVKLKTASQRAI